MAEFACESSNGWSFSTEVWTVREYEQDDDDSLEQAKREGRRWVENECQRQAIKMNRELEEWKAEARCGEGCVKVIRENAPVSGPIRVQFRILPAGRVRCLAELRASVSIDCEARAIARKQVVKPAATRRPAKA